MMHFNSPFVWATFSLLSLGFLKGTELNAQCPTLTGATLTSPDCTPGTTPCDVCPGDVLTVNATGTGLQPGVCVNWFYGTTNNFNPYNNEGILLGCAEIEPVPPNSCGDCPIIGAIFVDACGTEENNEYLAVFSGSGFYVDDASLDIDAANNGGSGNDDIGTGCGWQFPSSGALASIQTLCPGATVVGAGPGDAVPAGVAVIVFTSSELDYNYNFGSLCPLAPVIYVMQNGCARTSGAFTNGGGGGSCSTTFALSCGCSWNTTYNVGSLTGGNGAFVTDFGFPSLYGHAGCGFPPIPGGGGGGGGGNPPIVIPPFDITITQDMCNGGPYYIVGIIDPLPIGCSQTFTPYLPFDVPCPEPTLLTAAVCENDNNFNLNQIEDPGVPNGTWSGPGVNGNSFDPSGLSGDITLTFTPSGPCNVTASTTITVYETPTAQIAPVTPVCAGSAVDLVISFTGNGPWTFTLRAGGTIIDSYDTDENPFTINVSPTINTNYTLQNFADEHCDGANVSILVFVITAPAATMTLAGNNTICRDQATTLSINVNGAPPPFSFVYAINGVNQPTQNAAANPFTFGVSPDTTANITLVGLDASGCTATVSGSALVTVLPAPKALLTTDTVTICQGQPIELYVQFTSAPGPYTYIYLLNGANPDTVVSTFDIDTLNFLPVLGNNLYNLDSVGSGSCPGTFSGQFLARVVTSITASISGDTTLCGPGTVPLTVDFTGMGPYTFVYAIDGVAQPPITTSTNPYILSVSPTATSLYTLISVDAPGCSGTVSGQAEVTVLPGASGVMTGGGVTCTGGTGSTITLTFSGPGPYTYVISADNVDEPPVTTSNTVVVIPVNPSNGTFYELVSVSNGTCQGQASGGVWVFVFTPPTAELTGDATICNGQDTSLTIDFTGTGPFTIVYSINGVIQPPDSTFDDPYTIPVSVSATTTYALISVESPGCSGIPNGDVTITVNYPPQILNVNLVCNNTNTTYTVEFDLQGQAPFTVTGLTGTIDGSNHFVSDPIAQALPFSITVSDANGCGQVPLTGASVCNCTSSAGTMSPVLQTACSGLPVAGLYNNDGVLDTDDTLQFILHTGSGNILGTVLAVGSTPQFDFIPGVTLIGTTYYVSPVVGNNDGSGSVNLNDPCLSIAAGGPVQWVLAPTATLSGMFDVCPNEPQLLNVTFTGQAPYSLTYTNNGSPVSVTSNQNSFNIIATLQQTSTFVLTSVQDQHCTGTVSGQATVTVHPTPQIGNLQVTCDVAGQNYTLSFNVVAGDQATAIVSGIAGTYDPVTGLFQSSPLPVTDPFSVVLTDMWQCGQDDASGVAVCNCTTSAGTINSPSLEVCLEDFAALPASSGVVLDFDDALVYLLVSTPNPGTWTILQQSTTPVFSFNPGNMVPGQTYYVVAMAGNAVGVGVDPDDLCLSISAAVEVLWFAPPTAILSGNATVCSGESTDLTVQFSGGAAPYVFEISDGSSSQTINTSLNPFSFTVSPTAPTTVYTLVSLSDANGCSGTVGGNAQVVVAPSPTAAINFDTMLCQGSNAVFPIVFTGTPPYQLVYAVNGNTQPALTVPQNTFTIIVSNVQAAQTYTLVSVQDAMCAGTVNGIGNIEIIEPASAGLTPADQGICPGDSARLTMQLTGADYYLVIVSDGLNMFVFDSITHGAEVAFAPGVNTTYSITAFTAYGNPCPGSIGPAVTVSVSDLSVGATLSDYNGFNVGCNGDNNGSIQLAINGGQPPVQIQWSQGGGGTSLENLSAGMYGVTVTDAAGCPKELSFELTEPTALRPEYLTTPPVCAGESTGTIQIITVEGALLPITVNMNGNDMGVITTFPYLINNLKDGDYDLLFTDANGCENTLKLNIVPASPLIVDVGQDQTIEYGASTTIEAFVNSTSIDTFYWTPTTNLATPDALVTEANPVNTTVYEFMVRDLAGCTASDALQINVERVDRVFVPNVFSPNDDGSNDQFTVFGGQQVVLLRSMRIYDRWGELLFEKLGMPPNDVSQGWDGYTRGKLVMPGVYVYVVEVEYFDGTSEVFTGDLTVVR
ncbi:MAG: gliding motility-associated C-terminal domain-containing protein [Saprospiraceae bacterium]|nr:gliding motility-associated C-terminal domain-containing protein [Saprospiraceae bacterium]